MSSYICFGVRKSSYDDDSDDGMIMVDCFGRSSKLYRAFQDVCGYKEEPRELTIDIYSAVKDDLYDEKMEVEKAVDLYCDLLQTHSPTEDLFEYAKSKREYMDLSESITASSEWLKFFFNLDCRKEFWFG